MPYLIDKLPLGSPFFDRRVKLIPCQQLKVQWLYESGEWSMYALARVFRVDKNYIRRIVDPKYRAHTRRQNRLRNQAGRYYNRESNTKKIRAHRDYKTKLFSELNPDLVIPRRKASLVPHRAVAVIKSRDGVFRLVTTYSQHSAGVDAQKAGKIPGDAIITTWNKLRAFRDLHPKEVFDFEL
jgi:hypothetical protein